MTVATPEFVVKLADSPDERECVHAPDGSRRQLNTPAVAAPTQRARHGTSRPRIAYADGEPVGTLRLTFGSQGEFSQEFLDTYGMDAFFAVVPREAMVVTTRFVVRKRFRGSTLPFELIAEPARISDQPGIEIALCE
jgi:hypothetical protein